ncbi:S-layer protein domain-containing protein [Methanolobus psychrotolerans]|uniref:S-layer protein domain-containing protein n=1 Tax=Methanolobus psychrotolerans TaxID=1874706 RepID=UPI000B917072|nr:S-layer protein domain-containing protein [Methanolobus psychrotolerans]
MLKKFKFILIAFSLILLCSTIGSAANVTAEFSADKFTGNVPLTVTFSDMSVNATAWFWTFGDGNTSVVQNPVYTYVSAGTYDVNLTATNGNETDTETKLTYITVSPASLLPVAAFSGTPVSGTFPLTVNFTDVSTDATTWSWDFGDGNTSAIQSPVYTYVSAGTYDVSLIATNANGTDTETKSGYITVIAPASLLPVAAFSGTPVSGTNPLTVNFTDASTDATAWSWDFGDGNTSAIQSPSHTYVSTGTYDVSLVATNANGTDPETKLSYITVSAPVSTPPVASFTTNATGNEGPVPLIVQFNDTSTNSPTSWSWTFGDGGTSTSQNPVHTYNSIGTYNVTLTATNADGADTESKTIIVYSKTFYTGDRIWDENANQSTAKYIWDAKSFSGFFYDLESGFSSENMTISNIDRSLASGDIVYQTKPVETDFEHSDWGKYQVIGFMAEKYFAAYTSSTNINNVDRVSMMSSGQLSKILIDDDEKESVYAGSSLTLKDGYALNIVEVDVNGNSVFVTLTKDGDQLDSDVISGGDDYVYKTDLGDADGVVLIAVHFGNIFSGQETSAVFVQGIFQISDNYLELDDGESFGSMEITSISDELIEMENDGTISLSKGKTITLMGKIKLIVADNDDLRFAPYVDMSDPGTYELRGTVVEGEELLTWNPLNFEGFYYDIDEGIQTEKLELQSVSGRTIAAGGLVYTSTPASVEFEHTGWGKFNVIGFMAEKYFAGYTSATTISGVGTLSLISDGQLCKVLMDEDDKISVYSGSSLVLEEGYTLNIVEVDINGNNVLIELYHDGDQVESDIVSANTNYVYDKDIGDSDDVPLIIIHFNEVFSGRESNAVFVEGIFQISEDYISLESGDNYDKMEVTSFVTSIVMKNEKSISLTRDKDISLMGDVVLRVADSSTLRYYPAVDVTTASNTALDIDLSDSTIVQGDEVTITVTARGASISGATIKSEGTTIGTTGTDGTLDYTPSKAGIYEITAEKSGYTSGSEDLSVISEDDETKKMSIEVSPSKVYEGTSMTIYVLQAIGGDAISGAAVTFDGKSVGTTGNDGTVTYTATEAGVHKLKATKSGMVDAELDLKVSELAAEFDFSNIKISPLEIKQGKAATINVDITNTGTAAGEYTVDLKINDVVVDSQLVSLDIGSSTTIEFKHTEAEPGTYEIKIGDLTTTYEVFEKSGTVLYVLGAIGLAAVGGVAYLFTAGGWTVEIAQAKVAEAIEAIKELVGNLR